MGRPLSNAEGQLRTARGARDRRPGRSLYRVALAVAAGAAGVGATFDVQPPTSPALGGPDTRLTVEIGNPDVRICVQRPGLTAGLAIRGFNPQPDPPGEPTACALGSETR